MGWQSLPQRAHVFFDGMKKHTSLRDHVETGDMNRNTMFVNCELFVDFIILQILYGRFYFTKCHLYYRIIGIRTGYGYGYARESTL